MCHVFVLLQKQNMRTLLNSVLKMKPHQSKALSMCILFVNSISFKLLRIIEACFNIKNSKMIKKTH